jgi:TonB-dependent starch-binding outer membrane protein SusC
MQITTKLRRFTLFLLSMVLSSGIIFAQERTVTGKVTAEGEGAVPGVNVTIQGTVMGIMTGMDGTYSLKVPGPASVLVFSMVGYVTQAVTVGSQSTINVVIVSDVKALQEVVVTGYSTQRKRDLTGAVGVVETAELTAIPTGNITSQLQGRASGVTVTGNGMPGTTAKVRIRGFSSFENNNPLYIVDGVPTQDISYLNPNDVATMVVLKDAGAASVYGSRASNGVIVVNTKRGSTGVKVTYDMYYGMQDPGAGPTKDLLTTKEYADLQWLVYKNDGISETHPIYGPSSSTTPTLPSWAAETDWYKEITRTAPIMNHDLTLSGGNENARYFAGVGIFDQKGILLANEQKRYTGRFNSEFGMLKNRVKIGENLTIAYRNRLGGGVTNLGEGSPFQMGPYRAQSIVPVYWTGQPFQGLSHKFVEGEYGGTGIIARLGNNSNPVANLTRDKDDYRWDLNLMGNMYVDIKILNGLSFRSSVGGGYYSFYGVDWYNATYENSENNLTHTFSESSGFGNNWVWTNQLTFDKSFGDHKIAAVAGYESVKDGMGRDMNASRGGYFSTDVSYRTLSNGAAINSATSNYFTPYALVSYFAKADYAYRNKYMLSATIRRDGSSKFGETNRYGVFPSFSGAWRIGDEAFLDGLTWISDLKIRGSWGTMGNQLSLTAQNQYYLYGGSQNESFYDINGAMTSSVQGFRPTRIGNPDAKWETNMTADIGFEGTLFNDKVTVVFDWYDKETKDLLFQLELPGIAGTATAPYVNVASMKNTGIDLELGYRNNWGDFGFSGNLTMTTYNNNITKIADNVTFFDQGGSTTRIAAANRNMVGHPMSAFYGYHILGLFQSAADVTESPTQDGAGPGRFKFDDINGDKKITTDDRGFIGDPNPDVTYGLNLAFTYKNFDLTAYVYASQGNDIFAWNKYFIDFWPAFQGQKSKALLYDSWTPQRPNAKTPIASNTSNFSTMTQVHDYYIEDGSYARLKNLQLGYTIPEKVSSKINVKSLRLYLQAINLFTLTKYSGMDPELGGDDRAFGADTGNYPNVKQFVFGINLVL